uniref:Uncharacterized protein n=1 Tax=Arundo donax TaxID=35708 RepID=A0A0A8Y0I9_ARUDO
MFTSHTGSSGQWHTCRCQTGQSVTTKYEWQPYRFIQGL